MGETPLTNDFFQVNPIYIIPAGTQTLQTKREACLHDSQSLPSLKQRNMVNFPLLTRIPLTNPQVKNTEAYVRGVENYLKILFLMTLLQLKINNNNNKTQIHFCANLQINSTVVHSFSDTMSQAFC